ncbi:MAG: Extragenic suppressor of kinetochore protein 1 [Benniella sp.]|nr:MAG: Extragenic suppressor of kinetochore protein 1 [Benniella sp.]
MYWRFGHQNASVIDHLLENGNVSLEELLEQDDLIQECKAQNSKLIEYLREPAVLQQLLGYITSDDLEERARFKYPFIACEVIACEAWGIFESALSNPDILVKFWEFLDRPPPLNPMQASYFAKVIGVFLMKRTNEMLQFIKSQPEVVPKLLLHMSTSAIMDLLLKIISMEESPDGKGTWLSEQGLMPWLVNRLDPNFDAEVHSIASQVLLDIIAISQSSHPEQPSIGTNVLIDELKSEVLVSQLVGFMLQGDAPYSSSTLINGVTIFIELIRRNNSDYDVEPLAPNTTEPVREAVDLSDLLKVLASRIEDFKELLIVPRSVKGPIDTSIGKQAPLGFERLKICEMFAELLHCSNMAVLNSRPIISVSPDGTVKVPTVALNDADNCNMSLRSGIVSNGKSGDTDDELGIEKSDGDAQKEVGEKNKRNSKAGSLHNGVSASTESAEDHAATTDDHTTSAPHIITTILQSPIIASIYSNTNTPGDVLIPVGDFLKLQFVDHRIIPTCFDLFFQFPWNNFLHTVVYDMVHQVFHRPMGDIGRSDLNGTFIPPKSDHDITEGWNRRLTISIFKDGQLTKRITDAQRLNDYECAQPKGVRLGYMGHLTYIADETVRLLELYAQTSLLSTLYEYIDMEDWWNYVSKILKETKERDAQVLGGSRPNMIESHKPTIDDGNDDDFIDDNDDEYGNGSDFIGGVGGGHEGDVASDQASTLCLITCCTLNKTFLGNPHWSLYCFCFLDLC